MKYPFVTPFTTPFTSAFKVASGLAYPPVLDKLISWNEGRIAGLEREDLYKVPGNYPLVMTQSHCLTFDGVGDYVALSSLGDLYIQPDGTIFDIWCSLTPTSSETHRIISTSIFDGFFHKPSWSASLYTFLNQSDGTTVDVSYGTASQDGNAHHYVLRYNSINGTLEAIVDGELSSSTLFDGTLSSSGAITFGSSSGSHLGKIWNVNINGTHFPCSEGEGAIIHSTDGLHTGAINTADLTAMWAGRQDTYHYNSTWGFGYRENLVKWSEDLAQSAWLAKNNNTIDSSTLFSNTDNTTPIIRNSSDFVIGTTYGVKCRARKIVDTEDAYIRVYLGQGGGRFQNTKTFFREYYRHVTCTTFDFLLDVNSSAIGQYEITDLQVYTPLDGAKTVVGLGESHIANESAGGLVYELVRYLPDYAYVNSGVSGETYSEILARYDADVRAHDPDYLVIWGGTNDISNGIDLSITKSNIEDIVTNAKSDNIAEIIILNVMESSTFDIAQQGKVLELNTWLASYTTSQGIKLIDANYLMSDGSQLKVRYDNDGTHLNQLGNVEIGHYICDEVPMGYLPYIKTEDYTYNGTEKLPFLQDNKGGTWNGAETLFAHKQRAVGTFDGDGDGVLLSSHILMPGDFKVSFATRYDGSTDYVTTLNSSTSSNLVRFSSYGVNQMQVWIDGVSFYTFNITNQSALATYTIKRVGDQLTVSDSLGANSTLTCTTNLFELDGISRIAPRYVNGPLFDVDINGTLIPLNDYDTYGLTTGIHDSLGNVVGTLSTASLPDFWANSVTPKPIVDQDNLEGPYFTDGISASIPRTQAEIEAYLQLKTATFLTNKYGLFKYDQKLIGVDLTKLQNL